MMRNDDFIGVKIKATIAKMIGSMSQKYGRCDTWSKFVICIYMWITKVSKNTKDAIIGLRTKQVGKGYLVIDGTRSNDDVVTFVLEGLPSTYETISTVIVSGEPFLDLKTVRSLLTTHEMRLNSRVQNPLVDATSASPMVSCRFGDACKYLYNGVHGKSTLLPRTSGSASSVSDVTRSNLEMLQSLLAKFRLNAPNTSTPSPPVAYTVSVPPGGSVSDGVTAAWGLLSTAGGSDAFWSTVGGSPYPGPSQPPVQFTTGVQQQQGGSFPSSVHLGQSPSMPFHPSQLFASGSQGSGQATLLSNSFNTTTLQDLASGKWNMDTDASSHLNDSVHCLSGIFNMCIYPSVAVGDRRFIPVTNSGHSVLSTLFRPLRLYNVLITPNIVKNLISVHHTGDLYPVTKPSTIPYAFLTTSSTVLLRRIIDMRHSEFAMTNLGSLHYFLGISAQRTASSMFLSQYKFAKKILERACIQNCTPCQTPVDIESKLGPDGDRVTDSTLYRSLANALQYHTFTRPDLFYVVQQVCSYMHDPCKPYFNALKRILRYVCGTVDYGLQLHVSSTA
nr:ribonuclease H-like domain-containing protein [Tanacetum cinerariifolium]